jgi:hypothetical protein
MCSQSATVAPPRTLSQQFRMPWNAVSRLQSGIDSRPHKGDQSLLKTGQLYFPQDYFQSAAPDLSLLLTQDNTRSTSIENTPRTDFASVEWTDHPRPIAIAFFDDNTHASRTEYDVQAALHRASHPYDRSDGGCRQPGSWQ